MLKSPDQKIRQSATKMWSLAVYLPLLIGDLVPKGCEEWDLFIILLNICSIAASWQIKSNTTSYLEILIEEHHTKFRQLHPNKSIIPKMHYMVHYPKQIVLYGPLEYSWTMRHEAKLSIIKRYHRLMESSNEVCMHLLPYKLQRLFFNEALGNLKHKYSGLGNDESQERVGELGNNQDRLPPECNN